MTDSTAKLRQTIERAADWPEGEGFASVTIEAMDAVDALIEIVEAGREYAAADVAWHFDSAIWNTRRLSRAQERLVAALRKAGYPDGW